jgi:hypothetical protein
MNKMEKEFPTSLSSLPIGWKQTICRRYKKMHELKHRKEMGRRQQEGEVLICVKVIRKSPPERQALTGMREGAAAIRGEYS